jgi:hypothetical protein
MTIPREAPLKPPLNSPPRPTPTPAQLAAAPGMVRAAYAGLPKREGLVASLRQWKAFLLATRAAFEEELAQLEKDLEDDDLYYQTRMQHERRLVQVRENLDAVINGHSMEGEYPLIIAQANLPAAVRAHHGYGTKHIGKVLKERKAERDKVLAVIDDWLETLPTPPASKHVLRQTRHV